MKGSSKERASDKSLSPILLYYEFGCMKYEKSLILRFVPPHSTLSLPPLKAQWDISNSRRKSSSKLSSPSLRVLPNAIRTSRKIYIHWIWRIKMKVVMAWLTELYTHTVLGVASVLCSRFACLLREVHLRTIKTKRND